MVFMEVMAAGAHHFEFVSRRHTLGTSSALVYGDSAGFNIYRKMMVVATVAPVYVFAIEEEGLVERAYDFERGAPHNPVTAAEPVDFEGFSGGR